MNTEAAPSHPNRPRILRVATFPRQSAPGSGLVAFELARRTVFPTLYLTGRYDDLLTDVPSHLTVRPIALKNVPTEPTLKRLIHDSEPSEHGLRYRISLWLKSLSKLRELPFFFRTVPATLSFRPDIVFCHGTKFLLVGAFARIVLRCRLVVFLHGITEIQMLRKFSPLLRATRTAHLVFGVSPAIVQGLNDLLDPNRVRLASTGVDPERFHPGDDSREPFLLAVGSLRWQKAYPDLLTAVKQVFERHPGYRLVIVGKGPDGNEIQELIERLGLRESVEVRDLLSPDELAKLYRQCSLFVMSSVREGLPKALLEALASGTPAVVTDACNTNVLDSGWGIEVPVGEPEMFADAVIRLLSHQDLWKSCSGRAAEVIQPFVWNRVAESVWDECRPLLYDIFPEERPR